MKKELVKKIGQINMRGGIIAPEWLNHITRKNGKPHLKAIYVLSDICYWYSPTYIRDDEGKIVDIKQKFKGDLLQRSRKYYADLLSVSKRTVSRALSFLEEKGLIKVKICKKTKIKNKNYNNVSFIKPIYKEIINISNIKKEETSKKTIDKSVKRGVDKSVNKGANNLENPETLDNKGVNGENDVDDFGLTKGGVDKSVNTNTSIKTLNKYKTNKTKEKRKKIKKEKSKISFI